MSETDTPLLSVENLRKHYPIREGLLQREVGRVRAVDGVDLTVRRGETVGLIGESGCGKSTAARTLLGLEEPTDGTVRFDGEELAGFDTEATRAFRRRAGMVFQDPSSTFDPRLRVGVSVADPLAVHGVADPARRRAIATDLLERVGLSAETFERYPHELSGGQKQRAALARALVLNPDLLVADEPVSALDISVQAAILTLLGELRDQFDLALLVITHDMGVVREICDRVAVMYLGEIVEAGPTDRVFADPKHPYTAALVGAVPTPDPDAGRPERTLSGEVPDPADPPAGCRFHTRCREVIQPAEADLDQADWRQIVGFRDALADETTPVEALVDGEPTPASLRAALDLPDDPGHGADALESALSAAAEGASERAATLLADAFPTPCIGETPAERAVDGRRVACHLYESDEGSDASGVDDAASGGPRTTRN